ncbi:MAG: hypothetical protein O7H41_11375 [Planctomycetota bacterium]|nr:hypothetical protein [Planctomycetota bacterium]
MRRLGVPLPRSNSQIDTVILALGKGPELGGHPNAAWMRQRARELTRTDSGFLGGQQIMAHDRDSKFCVGFQKISRLAGVTPLRLPPRRQPEAGRAGVGRPAASVDPDPAPFTRPL